MKFRLKIRQFSYVLFEKINVIIFLSRKPLFVMRGDGKMYKENDRVVYGVHGVCSIIDLEYKIIDRKKVEYYVLAPIDQPEARFYVPTQNKTAVAKMSELLSKEELDALLQDSSVKTDCWISDENQRKQRYRELISGGNRNALINMVYTLHIHRKQQLASGRKFHLCDENFLRDAEKLLRCEFSVVLGIPQDQVNQYIKDALGV